MESINALCVCVEYLVYFQDRKHFPNLFQNKGCLKRPGFNKDGEKDVGPSVCMLFALILHLQKELYSHACPRVYQTINKQLYVEELKNELKSLYF